VTATQNVPDASNRMLWLRELDALVAASTSHTIEAELASEVLVPGLLDYAHGAVWLSPVTFTPDHVGLYKYVLRLRCAERLVPDGEAVPSTFPRTGTRNGYVFPTGAVGEIAALLSLAVQARFYLVSITVRHGPDSAVMYKTEFSFLRAGHGVHLDRVLFVEAARNATHLSPLLDRVRSIPNEHHLVIAVAAGHYARAVRLVGVDEEMVFVRLVSAVEKIMGSHAEDALSQKVLAQQCFTEDEKRELKTTFQARRSTARFVAFLLKYSAGFFDGEAKEPVHTQVTPENLEMVARAIYRARSAYLHSGDPMYLSPVSHVFPGWHMGASVGQTLQDRSFSQEQKLPCADFFHRLVRHCILARIDEMATDASSGR
jgi:hypothetical protein